MYVLNWEFSYKHPGISHPVVLIFLLADSPRSPRHKKQAAITASPCPGAYHMWCAVAPWGFGLGDRYDVFGNNRKLRLYFKNWKQIGTENGDIITISKKWEHDDFGEPKNGPTRHHECFICTPSSFRSFQSPACEDPLASVALDVPQPRGTVAAASGHTPTSSARSGSALSCYKVGPPVVGYPLVI